MWRMKHSIVFQILASFIFVSSGNALSLKEAIELGLQNSPEYQTQRSKLSEAQAERRKSWGEIFPKIQARGNYEARRDVATSRFTDPTNRESYLASLELTQPLFTGGALTAGIRLSRLTVERAEQELLSARQELVADLTDLYFSVSDLKSQLEAAERYQTILKKYVEVSGRYARIGRTREIDLLQSQVNLEVLTLDIEKLRLDLAARVHELGLKVGKELQATQIQGLAEIPQTPNLPPFSEVLERARSENPSVKALRIKKAETEMINKIDLSTDLPSLNFYAQTGFTHSQTEDLWMDRNRFEKVGLNLTIPLFSGLTSVSKRRIHSETLTQLQKSIDLAERELQTNLLTLYESTKASAQRLAVSQGVLSKARRAFQAADRGYSQGLVSSQDLVSFQRSLHESEKLAIRTRFEFEDSLRDLRGRMGTDLYEVYRK